MLMNRRFYLIPRDFLRSFQFTFRLTTIPASLPAYHRSVNSDSINKNKHIQYKNNTFEDKTRNIHQYT